MNLASKKMLAATIAAMLALVVFSLPVSTGSADSEDSLNLGSDSTTSTINGTYTIFVNDSSSSGWQSQTVSAYNGAQAVMAADDFWKIGDELAERTITSYGYTDLNTSYGDIIKFMGLSEENGKVWNVYVYINGEWTVGNDALGYYKCFSDYSANWQTANIALEYAAEATSVPASLETYIVDEGISLSNITAVTETSDFAVTFYLKNNMSATYVPDIYGGVLDSNGNAITSQTLSTGVTVVGYGSDAYLALKDALNVTGYTANVTGVDAVPVQGYSHYGWIDKIFGMGTNQIGGLDTPGWEDDTYAYWVQYNGTYTGGSDDVQSPFVLGSYSPITGAPSSADEFSMVYHEVAM